MTRSVVFPRVLFLYCDRMRKAATISLTRDRSIVGWDVGGVNTKVARVAGGQVLAVRGRPFELQRAPETLVPLLRELAAEVGAASPTNDNTPAVTHAVTMTAELSQMFRTKREGVAFVLDAIVAAFPSSPVRVFTVDGRFLDCRRGAPDAAPGRRRELGRHGARRRPASSRHAAHRHRDDEHGHHPDCRRRCRCRGAHRSRAPRVRRTGLHGRGPHAGRGDRQPCAARWRPTAGVSAEGFALAGDVHVWRGSLAPADYTSPTPDGRPATREFAGERLARVVCADREMLDEAALSSIADALAAAQVQRVTEAIRRVIARHPSLRTAVVTGLGAFIAERAARAAGLQVVPLADRAWRRRRAVRAGRLGRAAARARN